MTRGEYSFSFMFSFGGNFNGRDYMYGLKGGEVREERGSGVLSGERVGRGFLSSIFWKMSVLLRNGFFIDGWELTDIMYV